MDMSSHPLLSALSSDPPPIPASHPQFQRLDKSLICPICKEIFSGPVTVACGHSFCSQVCRVYLTSPHHTSTDSSVSVLPWTQSRTSDALCAIPRSQKDPYVAIGLWKRLSMLGMLLGKVTQAAFPDNRPTIITWCQNAQAGPSRRRPHVEALSRPSSTSSKRARGSSGSESPNKARRVEDDDVLEVLDSDDIQENEELSENGVCERCSMTECRYWAMSNLSG